MLTITRTTIVAALAAVMLSACASGGGLQQSADKATAIHANDYLGFNGESSSN